MPVVEQMHEVTREALAAAPTACVVNHPWSFGGFLAAEQAEVGSVMVALAALVWYSAEDPSLYGQARPPSWLHGTPPGRRDS